MKDNGDIPIYPYKKEKKRNLSKKEQIEELKKPKMPQFIIPLDDNSAGRFGNIDNFYDLSDRTVSSLIKVKQTEKGYELSSPFIKSSSVQKLNTLLNTNGVQNNQKLIDELIDRRHRIPQTGSYYNGGAYGPYSDILENYVSMHQKKANTPIGPLKENLRKWQRANTDYWTFRDTPLSDSPSIESISENIFKAERELAKVEESERIVKAFNHRTVNESMVPDIVGYIDGTLASRIERAQNDQKNLTHVRSAIIDIVGSTRGELEFNSFETEGEFYAALKSLELDDQERAIVSGFYGPKARVDGTISISKKPYLANQSIEVNKSSAPSKRFVLGGIDSVTGFDVTNDNVERYLQPLNTDAVYDAAHASSGVVTYSEVKTVANMMDTYVKDQTDLEQARDNHLNGIVKEEVENTTPIKPEVDYEANKRYLAKLKEGGNKYHKDEVIDSVENLSQDIKNRLKVRAIASDPVVVQKGIASETVVSGTPMKIDMLKSIYMKEGTDPAFKGALGTFLSSLTQMSTYEEAIEEKNFAMLTSISDSPMHDMPYGTAEEIEELTKTARTYASDRATKNAGKLSVAAKSIDFTRYWNELEGIREEGVLSSDDFIEQNGFFDAGMHGETANGLDKMKNDMAYESLKIEKEADQTILTQRVIREVDLDGISETRQRDTEIVNFGLNKGSKVYDRRSINRDVSSKIGITAEHLSQGYVVTDYGEKVSLQAYDEFNELMNISAIRGDVEFNGTSLKFTPGEWLEGRVQFGENSYSIRDFAEYYDYDERKKIIDYTMTLPEYPEVVGRHKIETELNSTIQDFVTNAKQEVPYTSRRTSTLENGEKVKYKVQEPVTVPLFTDGIQPASRRTKKGLLALEPIISEGINIHNYEEVFEKYGVDPKRTDVGKSVRAYRNYLQNNDPANLSEMDWAALDKKMEYRRLRLEAAKDESKKRGVVLDRPVDKVVQNTIDIAVEDKRKLQLGHDKLNYAVKDQTPTHVTLEADHILFDDLNVSIKYTGKKTFSELMDDLSTVEEASKISDIDQKKINKVAMTNVTLENTDDIIVSATGVEERAIKRTDVYRHIMEQNENFELKYFNKKGELKTDRLTINKTAHDVMSINWPWMLDDERSVSIGYLGVHDAINNLTEIDVLDAAERVNAKRLAKHLDPINLSDVSQENMPNIMSVVESAVHQKSKGNIIQAYMSETSDGIDPSIRVALKTLDAKGKPYTIDTVKEELSVMRDIINSPEHSFLYTNVDDIIHNEQFIANQITENAGGTVSIEKLGEIESKISDYIDSYTDGVRTVDDMPVDELSEKLHKEFIQNVSTVDTTNVKRVSNMSLFNSVIKEEIDKETLASVAGLTPGTVEKSMIGNYLAHDFPKKHGNLRKLPKKHQKELKRMQGNWKNIQKNYKIEWKTAVDKLKPRLQKQNFRDGKEARSVIGAVYDEITKGDMADDVKEKLIANREANIDKVLQLSLVTNDKGKQGYQLYEAYRGVNKVVAEDIKPTIRVSAGNNLITSEFSDSNIVTRALVAVYERNNDITDVADVLEQIGGTASGGIELLYGNDPNKIFSGLTINKSGGSYSNQIDINSKEGLAAIEMLQKITGNEMSIVGTGKTNEGNFVTVHFGNFDSEVGIVSDTVLSSSGTPFKLVENREHATRKQAKNLFDRGEVRLSRETPVDSQISKSLSSVGLVASSLIDYDFLSGKPGGYGLADPTVSIANLKNAIGTEKAKTLVFDFETSGLLGKIDDELFVPIEFGFMEAATENGKLVGGQAQSIFAKPNQDIIDKITGGGLDYTIDEGYTKTVNDVINGLSDNNSTYNLFKNYAKYDKASGDFYMADYTLEKVMGQGGAVEEMVSVGGKRMSKLEYAEGLIDSARNVVDFMTTPGAENTTKINGEIMDFKPFMKTVVNHVEDANYTLTHNGNQADNKWMRFWAKKAGVPMGDDLALKNIDTFETYKVTSPGKDIYKLDKFISENMEGAAHLGEVDVQGTLMLANQISENETLGMIFEELDNPLKEGDYFVKNQIGTKGVQGLGIGVYQYNGVKTTTRMIPHENGGVMASHTQQVLILRNMLSGNDTEVPFDTIASLRRDAAQNWMPFATMEDAMSHYEKKQSIDTNRTMGRAFNYKAWNDYEAKGNGLQDDMIKVLNGLHGRLQNGLIDQETMRVTEGLYRAGDVADLDLLALSNLDKLNGKDYFTELGRTKDFSPDRMEEYLQFAEYADSDEGKMVKEFLYEGDLRRRVHKRSNKSSLVDDYEKEVFNAIKEVRSNVTGLTNEIPNVKILGNVTQEALDTLGGQKYGLVGVGPFELTVNTTNRSTVKNSLWKNVDAISEKIIAGGEITDKNRAKNIALNEFVMPILSQSLDKTEVMDEALQENIKALRNNSLIGETGAVMEVDGNLSRTLDVLTERISIASKSKSGFIDSLETLKEVDMHTVIPDTNKSHIAILDAMRERLAVALASLDDNLATISYIIDGEQVDVVDSNIKYVQGELIKIKKKNDKQYIDAIQEAYDVKNPTAVLAHINLDAKNKAGREAHKNISNLAEVHYNAKNPELSYKSAAEIIGEVKSLYTDIDVPKYTELSAMLKNLSANNSKLDEMAAKEPEFFNYLRNAFDGFYTKPSNIKQLNEKVMKATEKYVNAYNQEGLQALQNKKNVYYQELADRAGLKDINNPNLTGEISDSVYDSYLTKYRAMEELGLIQTHEGKRYTGKVGSFGSFKPGVELDPSKVIIASSPSFKLTGGEVLASGGVAGYSLSDLTYDELTQIRDSNFVNRKYKPIVADYLTTLNTMFNKGDRKALMGSYDTAAKLRYHDKKKAIGDEQFELNTKDFSDGKPSQVEVLNQNIKDHAGDVKKKATAKSRTRNSTASEIIDELEPSILENKRYQEFVENVTDTKNRTMGLLQEIMGSKVVRYSAVAASVAVAFALTRQYTSDGGTEEDKQQRDSKGRPIDDNYAREYNGVDRSKIRIPQTARVEENGTGLTIRARAKNRNYVTEGAIDEAVSSSLNGSVGANVNIRYQDDRESINQEYVQGLFSNALK